MARYVALLRGIGPSDPNMRNEKLRAAFERLGFRGVQTVLSSGNVLFETQRRAARAVEATIEKALQTQLGLTSTTILRSEIQLRRLVAEQPFKGMEHTPRSSLNVTFLRAKPRSGLRFPYRVEGKGYVVLGIYDRALCSVVDLTEARTPDLMRWLDKEFGQEITTRTWKTVQRILKKWR
jgi:uncharacterized protein (DUF1697 family)